MNPNFPIPVKVDRGRIQDDVKKAWGTGTDPDPMVRYLRSRGASYVVEAPGASADKVPTMAREMWGVDVEVLIVRTPGVAEHRKADPKLVALIAKAQDWFARLASGRSDSLLDISREEKVTSAYVARVVNLAFLAPDIVQRIVRGDYQVDLNSDRLIRMGPLPISWNEQRAMLDMPA